MRNFSSTAMFVWPLAHIADLSVLAVSVDVALVVGLGSLCWPGPGSGR